MTGRNLIMKIARIALILVLQAGACTIDAKADPEWGRLANAIYKAENSLNHPYGIMVKYKHTTPRQACINTCKHKYQDWLNAGKPGDYLSYLQSRYAPTKGATNDPTGLNKNWKRNVEHFLS